MRRPEELLHICRSFSDIYNELLKDMHRSVIRKNVVLLLKPSVLVRDVFQPTAISNGTWIASVNADRMECCCRNVAPGGSRIRAVPVDGMDDGLQSSRHKQPLDMAEVSSLCTMSAACAHLISAHYLHRSSNHLRNLSPPQCPECIITSQ